MLTTLYGAVFANVLVAPLLARLQSAAVENEASMNLTHDWILMIARGETATIVEHGRGARRVPDSETLQEWEPIGVPQRR